ncbi:MAG: acyl carrier protein [Rhodobacteraceae bacterium]|nr:acyl carrier protein [Paracoccaceae bacterium]
MTPEKMRAAFVEELVRVAPDIDPATLADDDHLQDDLELDSMDFLNLVSALHRRLGIEIAEADYGQLSSTRSAVAFLLARQG